MLAAVQKMGWLSSMWMRVSKNKEYCLAVQQAGRALEYADESLKKDKDIILAVINGEVYEQS